MNIELAVLVFLLGLIVSFFSGLLGIGGGIIMTPLLLYLPPLLVVGNLSIHEVAGLTMVQGLVGAFSGMLRHRAYGFVHNKLVIVMGTAIAFSSLTGAIISRFVSPQALLAVFALLALVAAILMLLPNGEDDEREIILDSIILDRPLALLVSVSVGFLGGLVGQGGAFILIPLMLHLLKLPTRITIGSSLGIVLFSAAAGFIGKLGSGQIDLPLAIALAAGAIPGAQIGARASVKLSAVALRLVLAAIIGLTAINIWYGLLVH